MNYPIIDKTYGLLIYSIPILRKFPKDQRYLLAQRIENKYLDFLDNNIKAVYYPNNRKQLLSENNLILESLRLLWRLAKDLGFVSYSKYSLLIEKIKEVGKMIGGWLKFESNLKNSTENFC